MEEDNLNTRAQCTQLDEKRYEVQVQVFGFDKYDPQIREDWEKGGRLICTSAYNNIKFTKGPKLYYLDDNNLAADMILMGEGPSKSEVTVTILLHEVIMNVSNLSNLLNNSP